MKKIVAFVNLKSGSVPPGGDEALARVLSELGYSTDIIGFEDGDIKESLQSAIDQSPDYLIAWGRDGSINRALSLSGENGPGVLALPGGTMNLLHHRLHHERTVWEDILVSALTEPEVVPWPAGEVDVQQACSEAGNRAVAPARRAMDLKSAATQPEPPLPEPSSDPGMTSTPQEGQAPSGALDAEGHRPVLERSRKIR